MFMFGVVKHSLSFFSQNQQGNIQRPEPDGMLFPRLHQDIHYEKHLSSAFPDQMRHPCTKLIDTTMLSLTSQTSNFLTGTFLPKIWYS